MENKKKLTLCVYKILFEYSDENHPLTHQDIIDYLKKDFDMEFDRKAVGNSIDIIDEIGYEIIKNPGGGCYLLDRPFEPSMVSFLIDAIFSSKAINGKQATELASAVGSTLSKHQREKYRYAIVKSGDRTRTKNKNTLYNVGVIAQAIEQKKRIEFQYLCYDETGKIKEKFGGMKYHASPYYLVNSNGNYYCILHRHKYSGIQSYRIDYMSNLRIYEEDPYGFERKESPDVVGRDFNITKYLNEHVYLFGGEVTKAIVALNAIEDQQYVYEWFSDAKTYKRDDQLVCEFSCDENALYYWAMQYNEHIRVLEPKSVVDKIYKSAENIIKYYYKIDKKS